MSCFFVLCQFILVILQTEMKSEKNNTPILPTIIATGFGSGFWPWGPGTAGSVVAAFIWWLLSLWLGQTALCATTLCLVVVFTAIGTWATARLQPYWGDDPSRVVVDEMVGVWIPLAFVDVGDVWMMVLSVLLFRFFDILKPLGIRNLDRRVGAFWVMADDLLAGVYSLIILLLAEWVI